MNGLALCAGAGGLELGLHLALGDAYRTVVGVEWEASASAVLVARQQDGSLPPFPIWDSVATFDGKPWRGVVDIVSGGFPCQPFSVAGKKLGDADPRHLWPHIARIIGECQPRFIFLENVPGLLTTPLADGRGVAYELVEADLHELGYIVASGLFTAAEVGAPHQRERLFILAHRKGSTSGDIEPLGIGRAATGPGGDGAGLEYAARTQRSRGAGGGTDSERWAASRSGAGDSDVADATLGGQRERGESPRGHGQSDGRDFAMADPRVGQLPEPWRGQEGRTGAGSAGAGVLDDTIGQRGRSGDGGREDAADVDASSETLPPFPPGPSDADAWLRILRERPDLAPAVESPVRGVADGLAPGAHEFSSLVRRVEECMCECHNESMFELWEDADTQPEHILQSRVCEHGGGDACREGEAGSFEKEGAESLRTDAVSAVRGGGPNAETPREFAASLGRSDPLHGLPRQGAPGERFKAMCRACELPSVRRGVHAGTDLALCALQQAGMLEGIRSPLGGETVEWAHDGSAMRVVRDSVLVYEGTRDDLFALVWEQARLATSDLTRTAQLRITGNGVVPQCASLAFRTLWGSLADPGHTEREIGGGQ